MAKPAGFTKLPLLEPLQIFLELSRKTPVPVLKADCAKRSGAIVIPTIANAADFPDNQHLNSEATHVGKGILTAWRYPTVSTFLTVGIDR